MPLQDIVDKTNRLEGQANDLQKQVDATKVRIKGEDDLINGIQQAGNKVGGLSYGPAFNLLFRLLLKLRS